MSPLALTSARRILNVLVVTSVRCSWYQPWINAPGLNRPCVPTLSFFGGATSVAASGSAGRGSEAGSGSIAAGGAVGSAAAGAGGICSGAGAGTAISGVGATGVTAGLGAARLGVAGGGEVG